MVDSGGLCSVEFGSSIPSATFLPIVLIPILLTSKGMFFVAVLWIDFFCGDCETTNGTAIDVSSGTPRNDQCDMRHDAIQLPRKHILANKLVSLWLEQYTH